MDSGGGSAGIKSRGDIEKCGLGLFRLLSSVSSAVPLNCSANQFWVSHSFYTDYTLESVIQLKKL
jgi:hypothetical protein